MNVIAMAHVNSSCTINGYRVARFGNDKVYPNIDTILGTLERRRTL
jgi:very-short-patch-repair endonuclease